MSRLLSVRRFMKQKPLLTKNATLSIKWSRVNPKVNLGNSYYELFDIDLDFTQDELKRARLRLLNDFHPDKVGGDKQFYIIEGGYEILTDETRRKQYNERILQHDPNAKPTRTKFSPYLRGFLVLWACSTFSVGFYLHSKNKRRRAEAKQHSSATQLGKWQRHERFKVKTNGPAAFVQGHRDYMEDAFVATRLEDGNQLFVVFDGHGGAAVAAFCERFFAQVWAEEWSLKGEGQNIEEFIAHFLPSFDEKMQEYIKANYGSGGQIHYPGATATGVFINDESVFVFNVGDSRTILFNQEKLHFATADHKPDDPCERERIESNKFCYVSSRFFDVPRVNGQLALSRALGDYHLKQFQNRRDQQPVVATPDTSVFKRGDITRIVIVSDGVSDVLSNESLATLSPVAIVQAALDGGSRDNCTALVIEL